MRKRRPYFCGKIRPAAVAIAAVAVVGIAAAHFVIGPTLAQMTVYQAKTLATNAVNEASSAAAAQADANYDQLAVIHRSTEGKVTSVQANMPRINALASEITTAVAARLDEMGRQPVNLPLGTLIGGQLFAGRGPTVRFYVVYGGGLESNIQNQFTSAGINQTLHRIVLQFRVEILGVLPGYRAATAIQTEICLAETVIIGDVPEYYTQVEGVDDDPADIISNYGPGQNAIS